MILTILNCYAQHATMKSITFAELQKIMMEFSGMCRTTFKVITQDDRLMIADCPKDFPSCHFVTRGNLVECFRCDSEWRLVVDDDGERVALRVRYGD